MEQTPRANRVHIGFFGRRNAGKSSLINAIAGQTVSVVSPVCGTTTDTVEKAMELLPIGAVVLIDTPGLDDVGTLGSLRVRQAKRALTHTDIAVMVIDAAAGMTPEDREILQQLEQRHIPTIQVWNKCDQATPRQKTPLRSAPPPARNPGTQGGTGQVLSKAAHRPAICPPVRQPAASGRCSTSGDTH